MKNQDRLYELNNCLLKKSFLVNFQSFSSYLADHFDVNQYAERSFNRDIQALKELVAIRFPQFERSYGSLLKYARSTNSYYYVREDISAFPGFSEKEMTQLASSIEQNKHLFTDGLGKGILQKLSAIGLENRLSKYHQDIKWPALQLIKDGERSGGEWLATLLEKIYKQEVVEISHKGLKKSSGLKKIKALPLMIKEYNNGWYTGWYLLFYPIVGDSKLIRPQVSDLWCFALDRIVDISTVKESYQIRISDDFNPMSYFENMLGVFRDNSGEQKKQKIVIQIHKESWLRLYIEKYPIHYSQQIVDQSEELFLVELNLELTKDFENFIFQYLDEIKIIQPLELNLVIKERLQKVHLD